MPLSRAKLLGVVVAIVACSVGLWWLLRPPDGFLTGLYPIDGDRAVFTMRHNPDDGKSRAWIGVVDSTDGIVWSRELPDLTYSLFERHGLTVRSGQVTVKVSDTENYAQILAFDLASGEDRWHSDRIAFEPSEFPMQLHVVYGEQPYDDRTQLVHGDHDRATARLVARDSSNGRTQWSHDLPGSAVRDILFSSKMIMYRYDSSWVFVGRDDGQVVRTLDVYGGACVDNEEFIAWDDDTLFVVDLLRGHLPTRELPLPSRGIVQACGTYGDNHFVFTVAKSRTDVGVELVGVALEPAAVQWSIDLGIWEPLMIARGRDNSGPDADPLRGPIARFVPVLLGAHRVDGVKLAVIDVADERLAWESAEHSELLHYQVFRGTRPQHFLTGQGKVVAIDGDSGQVTAAVELNHEGSRGFHAMDDRVWVYSMRWNRMNALPWVVLDGGTLDVIGQGNAEYQPRDITAQYKDWLGAP